MTVTTLIYITSSILMKKWMDHETKKANPYGFAVMEYHQKYRSLDTAKQQLRVNIRVREGIA